MVTHLSQVGGFEKIKREWGSMSCLWTSYLLISSHFTGQNGYYVEGRLESEKLSRKQFSCLD